MRARRTARLPPGLAGAGGSLRPRCPARRWHGDGPASPAAAAANLNEAAGRASGLQGRRRGALPGTAAPRRPSPGWRASSALPASAAGPRHVQLCHDTSPASASAAQPIRAACQLEARGSGLFLAHSASHRPRVGRPLGLQHQLSLGLGSGPPVTNSGPWSESDPEIRSSVATAGNSSSSAAEATPAGWSAVATAGATAAATAGATAVATAGATAAATAGATAAASSCPVPAESGTAVVGLSDGAASAKPGGPEPTSSELRGGGVAAVAGRTETGDHWPHATRDSARRAACRWRLQARWLDPATYACLAHSIEAETCTRSSPCV